MTGSEYLSPTPSVAELKHELDHLNRAIERADGIENPLERFHMLNALLEERDLVIDELVSLPYQDDEQI